MGGGGPGCALTLPTVKSPQLVAARISARFLFMSSVVRSRRTPPSAGRVSHGSGKTVNDARALCPASWPAGGRSRQFWTALQPRSTAGLRAKGQLGLAALRRVQCERKPVAFGALTVRQGGPVPVWWGRDTKTDLLGTLDLLGKLWALGCVMSTVCVLHFSSSGFVASFA